MDKFDKYLQPGTETDVSVVPTITNTTDAGLSYTPEQRKCFQCSEVNILSWLVRGPAVGKAGESPVVIV